MGEDPKRPIFADTFASHFETAGEEMPKQHDADFTLIDAFDFIWFWVKFFVTVASLMLFMDGCLTSDMIARGDISLKEHIEEEHAGKETWWNTSRYATHYVFLAVRGYPVWSKVDEIDKEAQAREDNLDDY